MVTEIQLIRDGRVLFRVPIPSAEDKPERAELDLDDQSIEKLVSIFDIASNERRLRLMLELARRGEMTFSDMVQISVNPKLVAESIEPMMREGMVLHGERGSCYKYSQMGTILAYTMTAGFGRLLVALEELEEDSFE